MIMEGVTVTDEHPGEPWPARQDTVYIEVPVAEPTPVERVMLPHDKIYVVLAVVLVIWFGILFFLFKTDRRVRNLERTLDQNITDRDRL